MTQDLNTEIKIGADASGVEAGVASAKRSLAGLGQSAEQVGRTGGEGLKKIGAGGEESARRLDSVTKNIVASLQRQIAAAEAGGTATRQYQESIARLRGADVSALKPYLDQLDAARDKAEKAAKANAGLGNSIGALSGPASLARSALTAMLGSITLGAMVGFVRGINDGIDALNDIKDATGSTIENISALEDVAKRTGHSMDVVTTSMIKLNQVLADAKPGSAQALALDAIGLSASELRSMDPAEALLKIAQALTQYEDDANKARLVQELFGKSIREVMPFLNDLAEKGKLVAKVTTQQADEAAKAAKEWSNFQKEALDLARVMTGPVISSMNEMIAKFKEGRAAGRSFFSMGVENYTNWVKDVWQGEEEVSIKPLGIGGGRGRVNPTIARPSVGDVPDAAALKAASDAAKKAAEERKKELQEQAKLMAELSGLTGSFAEDWNRLTTVYKAGGLSLEQYTKAQAELLAKQPGIKAAADAEAKAKEAIAKANLEAAQTHERYITSLLSGVEKTRADVAAQEEATRRMGLSKEAVAELDSAKLEMLATDLELQAIKAMDRNLDEQAYNALKAQADAYRDLAAAKRAGASKEQWLEAEKESAAAAKKAAEDWERTAEKINDSITDALMRGFESGKDFAKNFRDTLVNSFKTLVLRPVISFIINPIGNAISSMFSGFLGSAGSSGGSLGGLGSLGNLGSLWSMGSNLLSGIGGLLGIGGAAATGLGLTATAGAGLGLASAGGGLGLSLGGTGLGIGAGSAGAGMIGSGIGGSVAAGGTGAAAGGLMSSAMTAIPYIGAIIAIVSILAGMDDSGTYHTGGAAQYSADKGLSSGQSGADYDIGFGRVEAGEQTISAVGTLAKGLGEALDGIAVSFGQTAGFEIATAFADDTSEDGAWGALRISKDGKELLNWDDTRQSKWAPKEFADGEEGYKQYLAAIAKDTRQVLLDMDLPSWADKMLTSIGESASMEQLSAALTQIGVVQSAFVSLGKNLVGFADYSDEAKGALMELSGGIDALVNNASNYYSNFYSPAEQRANLQEQVNEALAGVDIQMPDIDATDARKQYRALIEAQDENTEEGRKAIAMLLQMAGVFAQITVSADEVAATIANQRNSLEERLLKAQGKDRELLDRQRKAEFDALYKLDPALAALVTQIYELEDASEAAARAEADRVAAIDKGYTNLQAAYDRQRKVLEGQLDGLSQYRSYIEQQQSLQQESLGLITGVFELVRSNAQELYGEVQSTATMQALQGQTFIAQALAAAQTTGYLPEQQALQEAISAARAGITDGAYTTQFERDRDTLVLAGRLSGLEAISGKQKTAAEQQLEALQQQIDSIDDQTEALNRQIELQQEALDYWQEQIDIANGVYDATMSVEQAVSDLAKALGVDLTVNTKQPYLEGSKAPGSGGGAGAGGASFGGGGSTAAQEPARYSRLVYGGTAGVGYEPIRDKSLIATLDKLAPLYHSFDGTGDLAGLHAAMKAAGGSIAYLSILSGNYESDWVKAFAGIGLPAFAEGGMHAGGLRLVGERGWEVEATGPARYWNQQQLGSALAGGGGDVAEELRQLRAQVSRLEAAANRTADSTGDMAEQLDRVTANGNAMRTKAIA